MGFGIGILITRGYLLIGGVHKIQIFNKGVIGIIFTKIFGEDFGGVRGTATP